MKKILIIAGPNGAGKTTFAEEFLPNEADCPEFVNADLIAAGLSPFQPDQVAFAAARLMLGRIAELVAHGKSFAFETTLATRLYLRLIPKWQEAGYRVLLHFLKLPDPEMAIQRVARRVRFGGHDIPEAIIRRRFRRGLENLHSAYLAFVDEWAICDASRCPAVLIDAGDPTSPEKLMEDDLPYHPPTCVGQSPRPLRDPRFAGAQAAMDRAAAKVIARDRAAGLEPVVARPKEEPNKP